MKRKCKLLAPSKDGKRAIYLDLENESVLKEYLFRDDRHKDKTRFFIEIINGNLRHPNYKKVEINKKCENVTEMRFFVGQENDRIYCKELRSKEGVFIVIAAILHEKKKSENLSAHEISLIEKVGGYDYEV